MTKPGDPKRPTGDDPAVSRLEKALKAAEALIEDQRQRLKSLGAGREESLRALTDIRDELKRVSRERDELRKQLSRLDSMQTETIALPEDFRLPSPVAVPSLDDLMGALGDIQSPRGGPAPVAGHLHQRVESEAAGSGEMISPEVVFPEKFAATAETAGQKAPVAKVLVLLDAERPIKYPLFKDTMTIGRAESADIQINNDFLSRLHARIVSTPNGAAIEDIESKNGIRVNAKLVTTRQELHHGDVVDLGRLRFRYIDAAYDAD